MVVSCSALLGKWQGILWYLAVRVVPLSPLRLAHTDIYRRLHWLCSGLLLLRSNRVSTASPSAFLLALLVIWLGGPVHSVKGDSKGRQPVREKGSKKKNEGTVWPSFWATALRVTLQSCTRDYVHEALEKFSHENHNLGDINAELQRQS